MEEEGENTYIDMDTGPELAGPSTNIGPDIGNSSASFLSTSPVIVFATTANGLHFADCANDCDGACRRAPQGFFQRKRFRRG
eukprot:COSAG01_NODE_1112_length_11654_cov_8.254435_15_plen_82_part_00